MFHGGFFVVLLFPHPHDVSFLCLAVCFYLFQLSSVAIRKAKLYHNLTVGLKFLFC